MLMSCQGGELGLVGEIDKVSPGQEGEENTISTPRVGCPQAATKGTFDATRLNNARPIITPEMFSALGASREGENINGPSMIRLPDWLPRSKRANSSANYYLYFGHHDGDYIRMAWAANATGPWTLFNVGSNSSGSTPGRGVLDLDLGSGGKVVDDDRIQISDSWIILDHIASPDVYVDDEKERIVLYFHGPGLFDKGDGNGFKGASQNTFVATSSDGLNFNQPSEGGQSGHGIRPIAITLAYARLFIVDDQMFAFTNQGIMSKAPDLSIGPTDDIGWEPNEISARRRHPWPRLDSSPIRNMYADGGQDPKDPRHFAIHQRCQDPDSVFVFWTAKRDAPERIFLTRFDLSELSGSARLDPVNWRPVGQKVLLKPDEIWEGGDLWDENDPANIPVSGGSDGVGVPQLRDPAIFVDADGRVYLLYSGLGEGAIGIAELTFSSTSNAAGPQGDLDL